jgi:hypothetical protein
MKTVFRKFIAALGIVFIATMLAATANAECGSGSAPHSLLKPQSWQGDNGSAPASLLYVHDSTDPIVGMWKVTLTAKGNGPDGPPDGVPLDNAVVVWHSDGTEIMNSGRPAQDGNFCMGVWKNNGRFGYTLNHFAFGNDTSGGPTGVGNPAGPTHIRSKVFVSRDGNSYSGAFTLDAYDTSGNLLAHITGVVTATRITVDTPVSVFF